MFKFPEGHSEKWWKSHPEALVKALDERNQKIERKREPEVKQSHRLSYLRSTGFVSLVLAIGAVLMDNHFWWFVVFAYIGMVIALIDFILEKPLGRFRFVGGAFFLGAIIAFTVGFVYGGTQPLIDVEWNPGNYAEGTDIHGIEWQSRWSETRITITNNSNVDLNDFDLTLRIGEPVAKIKQIDSLPCSLVLNAGQILDIRTSDANGNEKPMPMDATESTYRFICSKIPPHIGVSIVAALTTPEAIVEKETSNFPKEKQKPNWAYFHAEYKATKRPYAWDLTVTPHGS